ncbi:MAG: GDP-L-fucose synthase [bacterium]|nr:GDP-L-fucose synthase [bacterium]
MDKNDKIYIAGHRGLVGSAIVRKLEAEGFTNIIKRTRKELDLVNQAAVTEFFATEKPDYVFLAAAKVGGINANDIYPGDFIYQNLQIQNNIISNAKEVGVKKLLFLGSSCIYPKLSKQPMKEEYLLTGTLEPTNEPYAIAKIAGIKMCQSYNKQYGTNFISVMPTNLFGFNDNFDLEKSHVLPALLRKIYEAKKNNQSTVTVWGTGKPRREFLFVDDLADAVYFLMQNYDEDEIVNIGTGEDIMISELAELIKKVIGFEGEIVYDASKPDGTPRKLLDVSKLNGLGWKADTSLEDGIRKTFEWFQANLP